MIYPYCKCPLSCTKDTIIYPYCKCPLSCTKDTIIYALLQLSIVMYERYHKISLLQMSLTRDTIVSKDSCRNDTIIYPYCKCPLSYERYEIYPYHNISLLQMSIVLYDIMIYPCCKCTKDTIIYPYCKCLVRMILLSCPRKIP